MRRIAFALVLAACAPEAPDKPCTRSEQCGPGGVCEYSTLRCSFSDDTCPSGRRVGELSGPHAESCVPFGETEGSMCDEEHACLADLSCELGRCVAVKQLTASKEGMAAHCTDDRFALFSGKIVSVVGEPAADGGRSLDPVRAIAVGVGHLITIDAAGTMRVGDATSDMRHATADRPNTTKIASYGEHSCAASGSNVVCWGANDAAQTTSAELPAGRNLDAPIDHLATGDNFSCAAAGGRVYCWGGAENWGGAVVGDVVMGLPAGAIEALVGGSKHACAIVDGTAWCWGENAHHEVSESSARTAPPTQIAIPGRVISVAAGEDHSCAVTADRDLWCWGSDNVGQIGAGGAPTTSPVRVNELRAVGPVAAGDFFTCALFEDAIVYCRGIEDFLFFNSDTRHLAFDWFPACIQVR